MSPRQTLKKLLQRGKLLVAPGCFDGLSARLVEEAGFEAAYLSGGAVARSMGIPDIGLVTMSEAIERAAQVVSAIKIPIIADADTGYGNAVNLVRTVREFERIGVAAIHIEDQITPKRCGHLDGKEVVSLPEIEQKLAAALATRTDPDFCIIARTDARGVNGFDDAIERARAFAKLGVDAIFFEAPQSEEELAEIPRRLPGVPLLVNVFKGGKTPMLPMERLGIDCDDRVDRGAAFVVGLDAVQVGLHQLPASQLAGFVRRVNLFDGGLNDVETHKSSSRLEG